MDDAEVDAEIAQLRRLAAEAEQELIADNVGRSIAASLVVVARALALGAQVLVDDERP